MTIYRGDGVELDPKTRKPPTNTTESLDELYNPSVSDLELDDYQGKDRPVVYLDQAKAILEQEVLRGRVEELTELDALPNVYPEKIKGQYTHVQAIYKSAIADRLTALKTKLGER